MVNLIFFGIFSCLLLFFTLFRSHPYRFPRFLVFESILSLIFLNAESWFVDPLSCLQCISWFFLFASLMLALHGFFLIKTKGKPAGDFEDTTLLITNGAYRYIRHPLYTSLLFFGLGAFLKDPSLLGLGLFAVLVAGVVLTANIEEQHNRDRFGRDYEEYCQKTKRFIPFIY